MLGAILILYLYRRFVQHRPLTRNSTLRAEAARTCRRAPLPAAPDVGLHAERLLADLVDVQAARLAEPVRARLAEAGGDREHRGTRVVRDDRELALLAHSRLMNVAGEDQIGPAGDECAQDVIAV